MHPRLQDGVSIGTFTYQGSADKHYFIETKNKKEFEISYRVYRELMRADGTHPLRISGPLLAQLKKDNILTTKRFIFDGIINRFIVFPIGNRVARFRPVCRFMNAALPFSAALLFPVSVFLKQRYCDSGIGDFNTLIYYLLIFLSLAVHECAHLISGICYGYRFTQTGLLLLGIFPVGAYVAHLEKKKVRRFAQFQFSLAGIESNIFLAAVFLLLSIMPSPLDTTFVMVANINVVLAVLNLLPASGLDGASALSALLGVEDISQCTKLFFTDKRFRMRILKSGKPGYLCVAVFAVNLISSVAAGVLLICDAIYICFHIFL